MATSNYLLTSIANRFFIAVIAATAIPTVANSEPNADKQWICRAGAGGEWQCFQQSIPSTRSNTIAPAATASATKAVAFKTRLSSSQWDWLSKDQLKDAALCRSGCDGAYIAPSPDWEDADKDPDTVPLRASADSSDLQDSSVILSGGAELTQGYRRLKADQALLNRHNNQLVMTSNVEIR